MRCNPWRWLWGLLPILVWTWLTVLGEHERIENDLRQRAEEALAKNGLSWAASGFSGRDGVVSGRASEEGEPTQAIDIVRRTWGVRVVEQRTELIDKAETYLWSAALRDNQVKLSGFVPNDATRKAIIGVVKANFPRAEVDDKMKLARGVPSREAWLGGISFGVKQLAALKRGTIDLSNLDLSVAGEAADFASYKGVKTALQNMPQSVRLAGDKVTPPVISPYTWSAKVSGSQIVLAGHVPSDKLREDVFGQTKKAFPKLAIVDRMETADGAPEGWARAVLGSIGQLTQLKDGSAEMSASQLTLSGTAIDEAAAEQVRKAWRSDVPGSFKLADKITFPKVAAPAPITPYVTTIDAGAGSVDLSGYVPSDAARAALLASVRARLPGRTVNDRLQIGAGAPEGWQPCILSGVEGLGRLGGGRAGLSDRKLDLVGQTDNEALSGSLPGEIRSAVGTACDANVRITLLTAAPPAPKKPDAEAERRAAEEAAQKKAEADRKAAEEARRRAEDADKAKRAEEEKARLAALDAKRQEATRCQQSLRSTAADGVIQFKRASADLEQSSVATLNRLAGVANACPNAQIEIEGHTDAEGTPERNARLSQRRAQAVVDFLTKAGVPASRLTAQGYGETRPVAPNDTAENRAKNRRIEFAVKAQ